jgi:hypothetical protein
LDVVEAGDDGLGVQRGEEGREEGPKEVAAEAEGRREERLRS